MKTDFIRSSVAKLFLCFAPLICHADMKETLRNLAPKDKLPAKYENYKTLSELTAFGNSTIELKFKSDRFYEDRDVGRLPSDLQKNISHYHTAFNNVIVQTYTQLSDHEYQYNSFKLDANGDTIDTYQFVFNTTVKNSSGDETMHEGYFLNKQKGYYVSWALDGDKAQKPFVEVNKDLQWSPEQVNSFFDEVRAKAKLISQTYGHREISLNGNKVDVYNKHYIRNNQWHVLYSIEDTNDEEKIVGRGNASKSVFMRYSTEKEGYIEKDMPNLSLEYFDKQKFFGREVGGSGQSHSFTKYGWSGDAYIHCVLGGDTLAFKQASYLSEEKFATKPEAIFSYYTHPKLKFSLFSDHVRRLYLVKHKTPS